MIDISTLSEKENYTYYALLRILVPNYLIVVLLFSFDTCYVKVLGTSFPTNINYYLLTVIFINKIFNYFRVES